MKDIADTQQAQTLPDEVIDVLEPRVLLDATLVWDLDATATNFESIEAMNALIHLYEDQFDADETGSLISVLQDKIAGFDDLFIMEDGQDQTGFQTIEDTFERVRLAALQVVSDYRDGLDAIIEGDAGTGEAIELGFADLLTEFTLSTAARDDISDLNNSPPTPQHDYLKVKEDGVTVRLYERTLVTIPGSPEIEDDPSTTTINEFVAEVPTTYELSARGSWTLGLEDYLAEKIQTESFLTPAGVWANDYEANVRAFVEGITDTLVTGTQTIADEEDPTITEVDDSAAPLKANTIHEIVSKLMAHYRIAQKLDEVDLDGETTAQKLADLDFVVIDGVTVADPAVKVADQVAATPFDVIAYVQQGSQIAQIIGGGALYEADIDDRITTYLDTLKFEIGTVDTSGDIPTALVEATLTENTKAYLKGMMRVGITAYLNDELTAADLDSIQAISLTDVDQVGVGSLIAYTQLASDGSPLTAGDPIPADGAVKVTVKLPIFDTVFNDLDLDSRLNAILPVDMAFAADAGELSFLLTPTTTGREATLAVSDMALVDGSVLAFEGASAGIPPGLPEMKVGFLNGTLTGIDTGHVGLYLNRASASASVFGDTVDLSYTAKVTAASDGGNQAGATTDTDTLVGTDFSFEVEVQELGENSRVSWSDNPATEYELVKYHITATLPTALDLTGYGFEMELVQSATLTGLIADSADFKGAFSTTSVEMTIDDTTFTNIAGSAVVLTAAARDSIEALFSTTTTTINEFLSGMGDGIAGFLRSNDFAFDIPLTDIDLADAFEAIADMFGAIPELFRFTPADLGFTTTATAIDGTGNFSNAPETDSGGDFSFVKLTPKVVEVTSLDITDAQIDYLSGLGTLNFDFYDTDADGELSNKAPVSVNLAAITPSPFDRFGKLIDPLAFLNSVVTAINFEFATKSWSATLNGRQITFASTATSSASGSPTISTVFAVAASKDRDNNVITPTFKNLGILSADQRETKDTNGTDVETDDEDLIVLAVDPGTPSDGTTVDLAELKTTVVKGLSSIEFVVEVDGVRNLIEIRKPDTGWGADETAIRNQVVTLLNAALTNKGFANELTVGLNTAGDGLAFTIAAAAEHSYVVGIESEALSSAQDLKGMMYWVQNELQELDGMPELETVVDIETGEFKIKFKNPAEAAFIIGKKANGDDGDIAAVGIKLEDQSMGDLAGVTINAEMAGSIIAQLDMTAGFNIKDAQADYAASFNQYDVDGDKQVDSDKQQAFDDAGGYAAIIKPTILDNVFFEKLTVNAVLDVEATQIVASANFGMIEIGVGTVPDPDAPPGTSTDANENFVRLNTELDMSLVGRQVGDTKGVLTDVFGDRLSGTQLMSLFGSQQLEGYKYTNADGNDFIVLEDGKNRLSQPFRPVYKVDKPLELSHYVDADDANQIYTPVYKADSTFEIEKFTKGGTDYTYNEIAGVSAFFGTGAPGTKLTDLIGRTELQGGIALEKDTGCAVELYDDLGDMVPSNDVYIKIADFSAYSASDKATSLLTIHNGEDRNDNLDYAMLFFNFADPYLDLGGLVEKVDSGVTVPSLAVDTSMSVAMIDIFDPLNSTRLCNDYEELLCLTIVDPGLIIDSLVGFGTLLEAYTENLKENFAFLDQDVPLLNQSLLDGFDFVTDYNDALKKIQAEDSFSFASINQMFDRVFGEGTVAITFDTSAGNCLLLFDISLNLLEDETATIPFNFSLENLLGEAGLAQLLGDGGAGALDGVLSSFVDARSDAELVIDPKLGLQLSLGLDLMVLKDTLLGENLVNGQLDPTKSINDLSSVYNVIGNGVGSSDLRLDWSDPDYTGSETAMFSVLFDIDKIIEDRTTDDAPDLTIAALLEEMNQQIKDAIAAFTTGALKEELQERNFRIEFDNATKTFKIIDPISTERDNTGVEALFDGLVDGAATVAGGPIATGLTPYPERSIDLKTGIAPENAYEFAIMVGDGPAVEIKIEAVVGRSLEGFEKALTSALQETSISRSQISDTAVIGTTVALSQLFKIETGDNTATPFKLVTTNFAQVNGFDEFAFGVLGKDVSHAIELTIEELDNSNMAQLLGFSSGSTSNGDMVSKVMYERGKTDLPIAYIDTNKTEIGAFLSVGTPDGLNMVVSLGPVEASIEGGSAFIGASGGVDRGFIKGLILDVDTRPTDDKYDLFNLYEISREENPNYLKLFGFDVDFETRVELPFSGLFGLLDPLVNKFVYESTLLRSSDPNDPTSRKVSADAVFLAMDTLLDTATAKDRAIKMLEFFVGDAEAIYMAAVEPQTYVRPALLSTAIRPLEGKIVTDSQYTDLIDKTGYIKQSEYYALTSADPAGLIYGPHYFDLNLDVDVFGCKDILELINDPLTIVNGLDTILATIQQFVDEYFASIDLPIIGRNLSVGAGFFGDFRSTVLEDARDYLETPDSTTDELPTTLDVVNTFLNAQLNSLFGTTGATYFSMGVIDTDDDHALYGAMSFNYEIFNEDLDLGFGLSIPGLNLGVDAAAPINLRSELVIDLGFGVDCNGFFLLNDLDKPEAYIELVADMSTFTADMNIGGVLTVDASANNVPDPDPDADNGKNEIRTTVGIDLFGQAGTDHTSGTDIISRAYTFPQEEFGDLEINRTFERTVYLPSIDFNDFAEFSFVSNIHVHLDLTVAFDGIKTVPRIFTDFIFVATFDPINIGMDLRIDRLEFYKISIDAENLRAIIEPVVQPIVKMLGPMKTLMDELNVKPFSYVLDAFKTAFPIFNVFDQIESIYNALDSVKGGDAICIGTYDFLGYKDNVLLSKFRANEAIFTPCLDVSIDFSFSASIAGPGVIFDFPLLTDPMNALNLLLGNFEKVDIATVNFRLLEAAISMSLTSQLINDAGLPGWAASAIRNAFNATLNVTLKAGLKVGYDMSGIVNFANTLDSERLLDGVFIESGAGSLLSGSLSGSFSLNAGIAGLNGGINSSVGLGFNDPNADGKLRLTELIELVYLADEQSAFEDKLGAIFNGGLKLSAYLRLWAGINLPWPLPDLSWSTTLFNGSIFGDNLLVLPTVRPAPEFFDLQGATALLNVGARAGANLSSVDFDGNDYIKLTTSGLGYLGEYYASGKYYSADKSVSQKSVIVPAGEGNNTIDLTGISNADSATITYTGKGNDVIRLPSKGTHVVFAGAGADKIETAGEVSGTYYVFAEEGVDTINIKTTGKVVVFADDDFQMRDHFQKAFANGGVTATDLVKAIETNANFKISGVSDTNPNAPGTLADVQRLATQATQLTASRDVETVTLEGSGTQIVFTGAADDKITVTSSSGKSSIYSGAGDDDVRLTLTGNATSLVEAGAGEDLIAVTSTTTNTDTKVYGWGAAGEAGDLNHLMRSDGDDIMSGGTGAESFFGQYGKDILSGGLGADYINGGVGDDILSGGVLELRNAATNALIDLQAANAMETIQVRMIAEVTIGDGDGADTVEGGYGSDVLLGGDGGDTLSGGGSADILVGDYGKISVSTNRIAETFISTGMTSAGGQDSLDGGAGGDILVGGGSVFNTDVETLTDTKGNNIIFGDFGIAEGSRILEIVTAFRSIQSAFGTQDIITTGTGNDVIIGGEQSDTIIGGLGGDVVIADSGSFVPSERTNGTITNQVYDAVTGTVVENTFAYEGNDTVILGTTTGTGDFGQVDMIDVVLGGGGDDTITSGNGAIAMLGDFGVIQLNPESVKTLFEFIPLNTPPTEPGRKASYDAQLLEIERIFKTMESVKTNGSLYGAASFAGNDILNSTSGTVYAIMGAGADSLTLGDGLSYVVTDDGSMGIDRTEVNDVVPEYGQVTGVSVSTTGAGNDTVNASTGRDIILTGDGADTVDAGNGPNFVLTDNGTLSTSDNAALAPNSLTNTDGLNDGDDSYTGGTGEDYVILGGGADQADLGAGSNFALADSGEIVFDLSVDGVLDVELTSNALTPTLRDGNDSIAGGAGDDFVLLGQGNDIGNMAAGANFVMGDSGKIAVIRQSTGALDVTLTARTGDKTYTDGNDTVTGDSGQDFVMMGKGDDTANLGSGMNVFVGDDGDMKVTSDTNVYSVVLESRTSDSLNPDGNDTLTTLTDGTDFVLMGQGNDTATLADGTNFFMGDSGKLTASRAADGLVTTQLESRTLDANYPGGNDTLFGGSGSDFAMMGQGDDSATLEDGSNFFMGDMGKLSATIDAANKITVALDSLDATAVSRDGADTLFGGAGSDFAVMGQGDDIANLFDGTNIFMGDVGVMDATLTAAGAAVVSLKSDAINTAALDGKDDLTTGSGSDFVVMGRGDDKAVLGNGANFFMGDSGEQNVTIGTDGSLSAALNSDGPQLGAPDGNDDVTTGTDNDYVVMGRGNDKANLSDGINFFMGDSGSMSVQRLADNSLTLNMQSEKSTTIELDGDDELKTGSGRDYAILGLGNDTGDMGQGNSYVLGADGTLTYYSPDGGTLFSLAMETLEISGNRYDGNDTITAADGDDVVILGLGDDVANVGNGKNRVLGDQGRSSISITAGTETLTSKDETLGGDDTVNSGIGDDILILGQGDEVSTSDAGEDILIGDNATVSKNGVGGLHTIKIFTSAGGHDSLDGGAGNDIIVGALGDDTLNAGTGEDFILGDLGDIVFRNATDVNRLTYTSTDKGGSDKITATGAGDNILIGQFGADTITGGDDDDWIIGDLAEITLIDANNALPSQSAVDRLSDLEFIAPELVFGDLMTGGDGNDFMLGGFGDDTLFGGDGQDFLFGDAIRLNRTYNDETKFEEMLVESTLAYVTGGYDILNGGSGPDVLVGHLGPDLFYGNTNEKTLIGDAITGVFHATFGANGYADATPERRLITVNFAGINPVDILTFGQLQESNGVTFSASAFDSALTQSSAGLLAQLQSGGVTQAQIERIETFLSSDEAVERIAQLVYYSANRDLIMDEASNLFRGQMLLMGNNLTELDYVLLSKLLERLIDKLGQDAAALPTEPALAG